MQELTQSHPEKSKRLAIATALGACALTFGAWVYQHAFDGPDWPPQPVVQASNAVTAALSRGKPAVIEFGANACVSCREMKHVLAELARAHGERITVADIDILKEREYISRYQIRLMPTQVFFDANGQEISRHMGTISGPEILARLEQVRPHP